MKEGDTLMVKTPQGVVRGYVTIESIDWKTNQLKMRDPLPAGTSPGDTLQELGELEFKNLARHP